MESTIRSTRKALGLSMAELARRLDVGVTSVSTLEQNESRGTAKIGSVRKALAAMGKEPLTIVVDALPEAEVERIMNRARRRAESVAGSMALEDQSVPESTLNRLFTRAIIDERVKH